MSLFSESNAVSGQIRLTSLEFEDKLSDNSSVEYQNLAKSVQQEVRLEYMLLFVFILVLLR